MLQSRARASNGDESLVHLGVATAASGQVLDHGRGTSLRLREKDNLFSFAVIPCAWEREDVEPPHEQQHQEPGS